MCVYVGVGCVCRSRAQAVSVHSVLEEKERVHVCTCVQVNRAALTAALDACLCTEEEAGRLRAGGAGEDEDPFQPWPHITVSSVASHTHTLSHSQTYSSV